MLLRLRAFNTPKIDTVGQYLFVIEYPPAEPEVLRLLAPQKGLISTEFSKSRLRHVNVHVHEHVNVNVNVYVLVVVDVDGFPNQ